MRKLLRADFARLFRDRVFWIAMALMLLVGVMFPVLHYIDMRVNGAVWTPDDSFFGYTLYIPVLVSVLTALFVGCEYSDGTMRNKVMVGHRRFHIYLAGLAVCMAAGLLLCVAYMVPHTLLARILVGRFSSAPLLLLRYIGLNIAVVAALVSLFVPIAMLCHNRAYATAISLLLAFALLIVGIGIMSALNEPEYYPGYSYTEGGVTTGESETPNPNYVGGFKRQVYGFLNDFLPGGQIFQLAGMNAEKPLTILLCDLAIVLAATGVGVLLFRRKNLK